MKMQQTQAPQTVTLTILTSFLCFALLTTGKLSAQAPQTKTPFYCNIDKTLTKAERDHKTQLSQKMAEAQLETFELADGYAFKFRPNQVTLSELADWATSESRCCPFFDLEIGVEREGGPLFLRVKGREGVKQFIRAEFKRLKVQ